MLSLIPYLLLALILCCFVLAYGHVRGPATSRTSGRHEVFENTQVSYAGDGAAYARIGWSGSDAGCGAGGDSCGGGGGE